MGDQFGIPAPPTTGESFGLATVEAGLADVEFLVVQLRNDLLGVIEVTASQLGNEIGAVALDLASLRAGIAAVPSTIVNVLRAIPAVLHHIWQRGFKGFLRDLLDKLLSWFGAVRRVVVEVLCTLKAILDYEKALYETYLRPVLNLLQRLRGALLIFRLLHLKFATILDAKISALEARIIRNDLALYRAVNEVGGILNLFIDPLGVFHRVPFLTTVLVSARDAAQGVLQLEGLANGVWAPLPGVRTTTGVTWNAWQETTATEIRDRSGSIAYVGDQLDGVFDALRQSRDANG